MSIYSKPPKDLSYRIHGDWQPNSLVEVKTPVADDAGNLGSILEYKEIVSPFAEMSANDFNIDAVIAAGAFDALRPIQATPISSFRAVDNLSAQLSHVEVIAGKVDALAKPAE